MAIRGVDENMKNMSIAAQKADFINQLFLPAAKFDANGFGLHLNRGCFQNTKWFRELMCENFFPGFLGRKTNALPFWLGTCGSGTKKHRSRER